MNLQSQCYRGETGDFWGAHWPPRLACLVNSRPVKDPVSKKKGGAREMAQ